MKTRFISLLLAAVLLAALVPTPAAAADEEHDYIMEEHLAIQEQIRDVRYATLACTGWTSFQGYCATWVTWQTCLLGIDTIRNKLDGNMLYDYYSRLDYSTGGYKITPYSGSYYTLEQVLTILTDGGKKNAYNILVGIERTPSADGQLYGHGVFIHAIVDGMVHFSESNGVWVAGTYWPEGYPIMCSLEEFINFYKGWIVLDGVIHFGQKQYADDCTFYPANLYTMVLENLEIYTQPRLPESGAGSYHMGAVNTGTILKASGLYETSDGQYWYQVEWNDKIGYVNAEKTHTVQMCCDGVSALGVSGLTTLQAGNDDTLVGAVLANGEQLTGVTVQICDPATGEAVLCAQVETNEEILYLYDLRVKDSLPVHTLAVGEYDLQITATVENYALENGKVIRCEETRNLWNSRMVVTEHETQYLTVTFDACGGDTPLNQTLVLPGTKVGTLPKAIRPGYTFEGWFTEPDGGVRINAEEMIQGNTKFYAHWSADESNLDGWVQTENGWQYYQRGRLYTGWLHYQGLRFYFFEDGRKASGWRYIGNRLYYFTESGVPASGWVMIDSVPHYMEQDGTGAEGWKTIDGETYFFHDYGAIKTGWLSDRESLFYLDETGKPVTSWVQIDGCEYLFGYDGKLLLGKDANGTYTVFDREGETLLKMEAGYVQRG